jgi:DNA-binding IclR family transcriptional regulator
VQIRDDGNRGGLQKDSGRIIERIFVVLEALSALGHGATLSQIGRVSGLPKTTVHRMLAALVASGAVRRVHGRYVPDRRLLQLVGSGNTSYPASLRRVVKPYMLELFEAMHHTVSLAVLQDLCVVYLDTVFGHNHRSMIECTSERAPAHCTAAGKLLLAYDPAAAEQFIAEMNFASFTPHTITSPRLLESELVSIRDRGLALTRQEYVLGAVGVAAPVLDSLGRTVATIVVGGPQGQFDVDAISATLRKVAFRASVALRRRSSLPNPAP